MINFFNKKVISIINKRIFFLFFITILLYYFKKKKQTGKNIIKKISWKTRIRNFILKILYK
ncbi:hypothetical protein [Candidatus Carsonella ruddii]|uniref:Uncharacterized protein n=1 Tax=Carsonella ruddii TaxID=114186 RepID=A0AAE7KLB6_CARRU|nr:hypothetical protein [Candidatus Carsonella ruddii]AGS06496.1 hypothetical protein CRDC_00035 [Candidatus Carsonella ruddii DC]ALA96763.1 hypothetical protein AMC76_00035 [Candidatus Carsonella ruddii]QLK13979.1 hypothetical protein FK493_00030 [Candidatus Carsonella ruddii]